MVTTFILPPHLCAMRVEVSDVCERVGVGGKLGYRKSMEHLPLVTIGHQRQPLCVCVCVCVCVAAELAGMDLQGVPSVMSTPLC